MINVEKKIETLENPHLTDPAVEPAESFTRGGVALVLTRAGTQQHELL